MNRNHGGAIVQCPNCRQTHALVFPPQVAVNPMDSARDFPRLEMLGAYVMWAVALVAIAGVVFIPH